MAVYTRLNRDEIDIFLAQYDLGPALEIHDIPEGRDNTNYRLVCETGLYILTIFEDRVDIKDLPYFLGLMDHLSAKGIPCPTIHKSKSGNQVNTVKGKPAAIIQHLNGSSPEPVTAKHCRAIGKTLAELHQKQNGYEIHRQNSFGPKGLQSLFQKCENGADRLLNGLKPDIARELDFLQTNWPSDLPIGHVHMDLFPDNTLFHNGNISGVFDFYFAANDFFIFDLAVAFNAWCFTEAGEYNPAYGTALLDAYDAARPLKENEVKYWPLMCRASAVRFLLSRLYDWLYPAKHANVITKDPMDYVRRLYFHQKKSGIKEYGFRR